jgi:hypothetical protein
VSVKRDGGEWKTDGGGPTSAVPVAKKNTVRKWAGLPESAEYWEATKRQGSRGDHPRFFCDRFGRSVTQTLASPMVDSCLRSSNLKAHGQCVHLLVALQSHRHH